MNASLWFCCMDHVLEDIKKGKVEKADTHWNQKAQSLLYCGMKW